MKLSIKPFELAMEHPFTISGYTRTVHTTILVQIEHQGYIGYGEGSPMRYLGETPDSITAFLQQVQLEQFNDPLQIEEILAYTDQLAPGNTTAKTAVDIALHDLAGKLQQRPCYGMFGALPQHMPPTTLTIGIDTPEMVCRKIKEAKGFQRVKIKLGSDNDYGILKAVFEETDLPVCVDANQGWKDRQQALDMITWLHEKKVLFVEQPMNKDDIDGNAWITEHSPVPIIADEAVQRLNSLHALKGAYNGINIKLVKCTGMAEASKMITEARKLDMQVMIGCTTETSCGIMAGAALAPLCDWADLDSPWLITNNPFGTPTLHNGRLVLNDEPGLGLVSK